MISVTHPTDRPNFTRVEVGSLTLWFSYETIVAFHHPTTGPCIQKNSWSNTTGKHLNHITNYYNCDRKRLNGDDFHKLLNPLLP